MLLTPRHVARSFAPIVIVALLYAAPIISQDFDEDEEFEDLDDAWYNSEELPNVDLRGLVANLSAQITWFKYVGNATLRCSDAAKEKDTLMMAIEHLHDCLQVEYEKCASEYAEQKGCTPYSPHVETQPCGTFRLGEKGKDTLLTGHVGYQDNVDCRWHLEVPEIFIMNLTFDEFFMEASGDNCTYDWMMVFDGNSTNSSLRSYGKFCGRLPAFTIYGTGKRMTIVAHTDPSIGKHGFRGVYQVMDAGIAVTMNGTQVLFNNDTGYFTLDETPLSLYDTYMGSYYYTKWHIKVDYGKHLEATASMQADDGASAYVYDGPTERNFILLALGNHKDRKPGLSYEQGVLWSHGFQLFVKMERKNSWDLTNFTMEYVAYRATYENLTIRHDHSSHANCKGHSVMNLNSTRVDVGVKKYANLIEGGGIFCFWDLNVEVGQFIEFDITNLEFNGPNQYDCAFEGLILMDGIGFYDVMRLGPLCYTEPDGLFKKTRRGVTRIVSSSNQFTMYFYTYLDFYKKNKRGIFSATVRATECQGIINPCTHPNHPLTPLRSHVHDTTYANVTDPNTGEWVVNYTVSCDKAKCCHLAQLPLYSYMEPITKCRVHVKTHGDTILATSKFVTNMVIPNKADQKIGYACQRKDHHVSKDPGSHERLCNGTEVYLSYNSTSHWSMGAFSISVEPAKCGYYRPELHPDNEFYPPCAQAVIRPDISIPRSVVRYVDHSTEKMRYYRFTFNWRMNYVCNIEKEGCGPTQIQINNNFTFLGWKDLPELPLVWDSWPTEDSYEKWSRRLEVFRDHVQETCEVMSCKLDIDFRNRTMTEQPISPDPDFQCDDGWEQVGRNCYKVVWPGKKLGEPLRDEDAVSVDDADKLCRAEGGHVLIFNDYIERDNFRYYAYFNLYTTYLSRVQGMKFFPLGFREADANQMTYRYSTGEKAFFSDWNVPHMTKRMPDIAGTAGGGTAVDAIRSDVINDSLASLQPDRLTPGACTVLAFISFWDVSYWQKVPCDVKIPSMVPICEKAAKKLTPDWKSPEPLGVPVMRTNIGHRLDIPDKVCPTTYIKVGKKCFSISSRKLKANKMTSCDDEISFVKFAADDRGDIRKAKAFGIVSGRRGSLTQSQVPDLLRIFPSIGLTEKAGKMWVSMQDPEKNYTDLNRCNLLRPTIIEGQETNPDPRRRIQWSLGKIEDKPKCDEENIKSTLCEINMQDITDACQTAQFRCGDGTCITHHHQCDGRFDCTDKSDEAQCDDACTFDADLFGRPIEKINEMLDNFEMSCFKNCTHEACVCSDLYFHCWDVGCIPISKLCDFNHDCKDGSDEKICNYKKCEGTMLQCDNGQCINQFDRCNYRTDCIDGSDEANCDWNHGCPIQTEDSKNKYMECEEFEGEKKCLMEMRKNDMFPDCPHAPGQVASDEVDYVKAFADLELDVNKESAGFGRVTIPTYDGKKDTCSELFFPCYSGYASKPGSCIPRSQTCVFDRDVTGQQIGCRNGAHLQFCEDRDCSGMYKCPKSYCLPTHRVCDGVSDCAQGEDEGQCTNFYCPGLFRCKGERRCIRQEQFCNDVVDCPLYGDDEALCDFNNDGCREGCDCLGNALDCSARNISNLDWLKDIHSEMRAIILRNNSISHLVAYVTKFPFLYRLDVSENQLQTFGDADFEDESMLVEMYVHGNKIGSITRAFFSALKYLRVFTIHRNEITLLAKEAFQGLVSLERLDLGGQEIRQLDEYQFSGLSGLLFLNLSYNRISTIENRSFCDRDKYQRPIPLRSLRVLDIRGNKITTSEPDSFKFLPAEATMYSDKFKYCCYARQLEGCYPPADEFSSCEDLIAHRGLRMAVWALGLLSVIGNVCVLHQRMKHEKETTPSLLVQHLSFSDTVMGCYLLIILSADIYYRNKFIMNVDEWHKHALCKLAGFLSMLSVIMSTFLLMLITVDRIYAIVPKCYSHGMSLRGVRGLIALGWTLAAILSVVPILEFPYFGTEGMVRSGICTMFNIIKGRLNGWEYSTAIFIIANFICYLVCCLGYIAATKSWFHGVDDWPIDEELTDEEKEAELIYRQNELVITRRLMLLVMTSWIVWLPIIGIGFFALFDIYIDKVTSAWVALFFMPLNAAINPYLYTFSTKPFRLPIDDLLLNWEEVEEEEEEEDEDDEEKGDETDMGESSVGGTTSMSSSGKTESTIASASRDKALKEIL